MASGSRGIDAEGSGAIDFLTRRRVWHSSIYIKFGRLKAFYVHYARGAGLDTRADKRSVLYVGCAWSSIVRESLEARRAGLVASLN